MMGEPSIDTLHDPYEDQLSAARYKAERDAAVQELQAMRERNIELWMESGMANELATCAEQKAERLGKLVWRLQNRLARSHRREKALRKGMREWRERAISGPVRTVSAYDLLSEGEREVLRMWPRFKETGEPVLFGDSFLDHHGDVRSVLSLELLQEGGFTLHTGQGTADWHSSGERVKRPVPAGDGKPLVEGQTVWRIDTGAEYWVKRGQTITSDAVVIIMKTNCDCESEIVKASQLTHTKPEPIDTWGRIEDDCTMPERDYYARHIGHDVGLKDDAEIHEAMARDLVRRARKLAEKED